MGVPDFSTRRSYLINRLLLYQAWHSRLLIDWRLPRLDQVVDITGFLGAVRGCCHVQFVGGICCSAAMVVGVLLNAAASANWLSRLGCKANAGDAIVWPLARRATLVVMFQ